ncbi:MAG: hypothetical protein JWO10_540 [Microbacteriaceae bacterium]|nr:hypothetical protein [Microbacteriaceae bacterium]
MASDIESTLGWSLGVVFRAWQEAMQRALVELPHGSRGFQILLTVANDGPPTQAALAAHLGIDRTVLTYVLDDLVAEGLLERMTDSADRRVRRLQLTAKGKSTISRLELSAGAAEADMLGSLSAEQRTALAHSLGEAATQIHRADPRHDACTLVAGALVS